MLTCIRLALTVVIAEGLGLSVAFALGPAYSTSVGAPARTSGQVVAAVKAAAQGLKSDGDAQGISTSRGVRVPRVLPLVFDTMDRGFTTPRLNPSKDMDTSMLGPEQGFVTAKLDTNPNLGGLPHDSAHSKLRVKHTDRDIYGAVHDASNAPKIGGIPPLECMHALGCGDGLSALSVDSCVVAPGPSPVGLASMSESHVPLSKHLEEEKLDLEKGVWRPRGVVAGSDDLHKHEQGEDHNVVEKLKSCVTKPSAAGLKDREEHSLGSNLVCSSEQNGVEHDVGKSSGADPESVHRELYVEGQNGHQNFDFQNLVHSAPSQNPLDEYSSNSFEAYSIDMFENSLSTEGFLNRSIQDGVCSEVPDLDADFWFQLFVLASMAWLGTGAYTLIAVALEFDHKRYLGGSKVSPQGFSHGQGRARASEPAVNSSIRGRHRVRQRDDQRHTPRTDSRPPAVGSRSRRQLFAGCTRAECACHLHGASWNGQDGEYCCVTCRNGTPCVRPYHRWPTTRVFSPLPSSRSSQSSSSRGSNRSTRSWFYPCTRVDCPCPASWDGNRNHYCCLTCRNGTPCDAAYHLRPVAASNRHALGGTSSSSTELRATPQSSPRIRAEVYTQSEPGQQSMRYVRPPEEGLAAADGRGPWYLCGCPRSCTTMILCLSGPRPDRCLACTTGPLFTTEEDFGGGCECECCTGPTQTPTPVATPGVRVMGRPLIGHLPFMLFMLMCSLMMPLIQGAPVGNPITAESIKDFLETATDTELSSYVLGLALSVSVLAVRRGVTPESIFRQVCELIRQANLGEVDSDATEGDSDMDGGGDGANSGGGADHEGSGSDSPRYSAFAMGGVLMGGGCDHSPAHDSEPGTQSLPLAVCPPCCLPEGQKRVHSECCGQKVMEPDGESSESSSVDMAEVDAYMEGHPTWGQKDGFLFKRLLTALLFFTFMACGEAVTCYTCYDQIEGCAGGDACLLHSRPHANTAIIAGGAGVITLASLLPIKFLRECTRSALDCIKMVANRPQLGTPVDITQAAMNVDQLVEAVHSGAANPGDAMRECLTRLAQAGNQLETNRLNALATLLSHMDKGASTSSGSGGRSTVLGTYSLAWALAGRIARQTLGVGVAGVSGSSGPSESATPVVQMVKLTITRPTSMAEFSDMITTWLMLCHATGLGHILALGEFIRDVVHDTISKLNYSWQLAHELLLVYFEVVETTSDQSINIRNVFAHGSQDTYLKRANDSMRAHYSNVRGKEEPNPSPNANAGKGKGNEIKWNGNYDRNATTTCLSYNLGTEHRPRSLNEKGTCKHNHVCDQWVSDKGPGGTCGGRHPRSKCDNPNKCDKKQT